MTYQHCVYARQGCDQNGGGILQCDIAADENESSHAGILEGHFFELAVANSLVAGEHYPSLRAGARKPNFVRCAFCKVLGEPLDWRTRRTQRGREKVAVQRLVEEKDRRLRRP